MSKRNIDKQVYEQYVDATVALFMEHYTAALTDRVLAEESGPATCPESLDRRCMEMIRKECAKQRRKEIYKGINKVLRSAAVILVALLSLSSILFMTVEAFRVPVINFFIEQGDGFWAITGKSEDEPVDSAFDPNDPLAGLLPEGYKVVAKNGDLHKGLHIIYQALDGSRISFSVRADTIDITLDSENAEISKTCDVMEHKGIFVLKSNLSQLAWIDEVDCASYLLSSDAISESDLFSIAKQLIVRMEK